MEGSELARSFLNWQILMERMQLLSDFLNFEHTTVLELRLQ